MPRTALIVVVPEAQRAVADDAVPPGVPAHITILHPFADSDELDEAAVAELAASMPPFDFALVRIERWDDGIEWLRPDPSEPFAAMTRAVWRRFGYAPYEGAHDVVIPHLTLGRGPIDVGVSLPIETTARELTLLEEAADGSWSVRRVFPLQGVA